MTLIEWLESDPLPEEIKVDENGAQYLGIDTVRKKIKHMESAYDVEVNCQNFFHTFFTLPEKSVLCSGSIEVVLSIYKYDLLGNLARKSLKSLVGAATMNIADYHPNFHYAATIKSLAICNAMLEYPAFGSRLNREPVKGQVAPAQIPEKPEVARMKQLINGATTRAELQKYKPMVTLETLVDYNVKMKSLKK